MLCVSSVFAVVLVDITLACVDLHRSTGVLFLLVE